MKKYEVHQLRIEKDTYFGPSHPIAVCDSIENANRIVNSLNKDKDENIFFAFGVISK